MNVQAFVQKWKAASGLTERAASQQHFLDLCDLFGEKKPADVDPTGTSFTRNMASRSWFWWCR